MPRSSASKKLKNKSIRPSFIKRRSKKMYESLKKSSKLSLRAKT